MYRAYHAIRGLSGPDGRSTNAVYGFVTMFRKLAADHHPDYIGASFDLAGPTFRDALAADYKANRTPMPDDLAEQIPWVHEACEALGVPIVNVAGFEADDVIGTLAIKAAAAGFDVAIVTGDKDFFQLVGGPIRVFNPRDDGTWYDPEGVVGKFGVRPEQVVDVLALMGDSIDNVKGVPGIGEKGARELIGTHGTLDALLANAAGLPQKRYREALLANMDAAKASRELLRIRTDMDVPFDAGRFKYTGANRERCYELFSRLGFRSLLPDYAPTAATVEKHYGLVSTTEELSRLATTVAATPEIGLHLLTSEAGPMRAETAGVAVSTGPRAASVRTGRPPGWWAARSRVRLPPARRDPRRVQASARERRNPEGRPRPEDGDDPARAAGHHLEGPRLRHDDRELPDRSDALGAHARRHLARTPGIQGADRRGRVRRRKPDAALAASAGDAARLRVRACRPSAAAGPDHRRPAGIRRPHEGLGDARATARARAGGDGTGGRARGHRDPAHAVRALRARAGRPEPPHLRSRGARVQHRFTQAARRGPVREAPAADAQAHGKDARDLNGGRGARGAGAVS